MTGKTVVVVSPLISLMHDQCVRLAKHGISACFLGSGQPDKSVEGKAMAGAYSIVYVCPETFTRVIPSLQVLARGRGIALFAVDEAHCISKWGHDFRPEYRRLSVIREKFRMDANEGSRRTIPIMALTATATERVRADILESLGIDKTGPKIIVTTLFRPNLKFSVHHSKTTRCASYQADFKELIEMYGNYRQDMPVSRDSGQQNSSRIVIDVIMSPSAQTNQTCKTSLPDGKSGTSSQNCLQSNSFHATESEAEEDEEDMERTQGDFDGGCAEFPSGGPSTEAEPKYNHLDGDCELFGCGPTIIYMPTRKETERLASFLSTCSVKAAAYHAKLPKGHLKQVHQQFLSGTLQVVVSTIAFGMGIDKANVRNVIHYGWPQSLEAYYQEAGRAGRDGLVSNCKLYCDMTVLPSLLPSRRDAAQAQNALNMLSQCFRYGLATSKCRVSILLQHFGEDFQDRQCKMCDVCLHGPPPWENLTKEAMSLLDLLNQQSVSLKGLLNEASPTSKNKGLLSTNNKRKHSFLCADKLSTKSLTMVLREQASQRSQLWWRGFIRFLLDQGYIRETNDVIGPPTKGKLMVQTLKFPEITSHGLIFLQNCQNHAITNECEGLLNETLGVLPPLIAHPEGDMIQARNEHDLEEYKDGKDWGRGWANAEIRKKRLKRFQDFKRTKGKKKSRRMEQTRRGRKFAEIGQK
ncbi:hypothetical protein O6H91_07G102000 [Diphasiastrum complanatum]|nr:hypothetical protein O6H91_07G102000 [Diphasiastrum complanatum]